MVQFFLNEKRIPLFSVSQSLAEIEYNIEELCITSDCTYVEDNLQIYYIVNKFVRYKVNYLFDAITCILYMFYKIRNWDSCKMQVKFKENAIKIYEGSI